MCDRTCPACKSNKHFHQITMVGSFVVCSDCDRVLAARRDLEAAPTYMSEEEAAAWQSRETGVVIGAEASDPRDDRIYGLNRWPLETDN